MKRAQGRFLTTLTRAKPKGKGKQKRRRWRNDAGQIFEEDTQHGELEKYNSRGWHEGVVDPETGDFIKPPVQGRSCET